MLRISTSLVTSSWGSNAESAWLGGWPHCDEPWQPRFADLMRRVSSAMLFINDRRPSGLMLSNGEAALSAAVSASEAASGSHAEAAVAAELRGPTRRLLRKLAVWKLLAVRAMQLLLGSCCWLAHG